MEFRILGPLEVARGDETLRLGSGKQLALFAVLLLNRNEATSMDRIVDQLWGEAPPPTAAKIVRNSVSLLRKALGDDGGLIRTRGQGYELVLPPDALDADRFERLVTEGRRALADGDAEGARALLGEALALWRGPALADFAYEPFAQDEIRRLEELRLNATEERVESDLRLGRHADVVAELESLVAKHPLRERLRGQLMLALYRAGRQAQALAVYQEGRRLLVDELGLEPDHALQELERAILRQDEALVPPVRDRRHPARAGVSSRRGVYLILVGAIAVLAVAVAGAALELRGGSSRLVSVAPNSVAEIDPDSNRIVSEIPVGARPAGVAAGFGSVWVANLDDSTVTRVDPERARVVRTIPTATEPIGLAVGAGAVWAVSVDGVVRRIDPRFEAVVARVRTFKAGSLLTAGPVSGSIAVGKRDVWVASGGYFASPYVTRVDPRSNQVAGKLAIGNAPSSIAIGLGSTWVSDTVENTVSRIDANDVVTAIPVGHQPSGIAFGDGAVWVADSLDDAVVRIDPQTNSVTTTVPVGRYPTSLAAGAGSVWVANSHDQTVSRIDPKRNRVVRTIEVGSSPAGVMVGEGGVWITTEQRPRAAIAASSGGGMLRVDSETDLETDPGLYMDPQIGYATCAKLLNYPDKPAPKGSQLVPEVAQSLPTVSADGRTYTFVIRRGFRFSPPLHEDVTAETFKYAIERSLSPKTRSPAAALVDDIAGEDDYLRGKTSHISGVVASGDRLVIRLTGRAPSFPARIATPFFCAVPRQTPIDPRGVRVIPAAGPYYVSAFAPGRQIVLKRNPNYGGKRPHRFERIVYTIDVPVSKGVAQVEAGAADYAAPPDQDVRLARRYGPGALAAATGGQRYFVNPRLVLGFLALNASRPLFADARMRRAVSYAIDRRALARVGLVVGPGIAVPALPTDQYLPPNMIGFKRQSVYPLNADLTAARRLAGRRHGTAVLYACNVSACRQQAQLIRRDLSRIGIDVETKEFPFDVAIERALRPHESWDIAIADWGADYADPSDFLNVLLDPGGNLFHFRSERVTRLLDRAAELSGAARDRTYGKLAVELAREEAPWVSYAVFSGQDFFSARVGCQVFNPVYGMDLGALCLRRAQPGRP